MKIWNIYIYWEKVMFFDFYLKLYEIKENVFDLLII